MSQLQKDDIVACFDDVSGQSNGARDLLAEQCAILAPGLRPVFGSGLKKGGNTSAPPRAAFAAFGAAQRPEGAADIRSRRAFFLALRCSERRWGAAARVREPCALLPARGTEC